MGKGGGGEDLCPFFASIFPLFPETPDTQANDRHSKGLKNNSCSVASKIEWFVDKFMKGPEICFVCLFVCFFLYAVVVVVFCFRLAESKL